MAEVELKLLDNESKFNPTLAIKAVNKFIENSKLDIMLVNCWCAENKLIA